MSSTSHPASEILKLALQVVSEAKVPDDLRPLAFSKVFDLVAEDGHRGVSLEVMANT